MKLNHDMFGFKLLLITNSKRNPLELFLEHQMSFFILKELFSMRRISVHLRMHQQETNKEMMKLHEIMIWYNNEHA